MESSSYVLEIPNDAYTTISQIQSRVLPQADWFIFGNNENAILIIDVPYLLLKIVDCVSGSLVGLRCSLQLKPLLFYLLMYLVIGVVGLCVA